MLTLRRYWRLALLCVVTALPVHAFADTLDDTGLWFAAFGNGRFKSLPDDSPVRWWFDAHYRLRDDSDGFNQSILRPGAGVEIAEDQVLWAGYAWIRTSPTSGAEDFDEHRFWQQWTATPSCGDWYFLHRSRFEQRWVELGDDVGLRWRQLGRAQKVLSDCPQWSLVLWDEIFFHLNDTDWGAEAGLDQNRAFLGFGYKRCKEARGRIEVGYLNQYINRQGSEDGMNHILSINYFF
ncbi:MAG: DUF2490 domain-containing protein [Planctomycetota bacterium]